MRQFSCIPINIHTRTNTQAQKNPLTSHLSKQILSPPLFLFSLFTVDSCKKFSTSRNELELGPKNQNDKS